MDNTEGANLLETVLSAYNQRCSEAERLNRSDDSGLPEEDRFVPELACRAPKESFKKTAPSKPKRKGPTRVSTALMADLDLGDPIDIQSILDTVKAKTQCEKRDEAAWDGFSDSNNNPSNIGRESKEEPFTQATLGADKKEMCTLPNRPSSCDLETQCAKLIASDKWLNDIGDGNTDIYNSSVAEDVDECETSSSPFKNQQGSPSRGNSRLSFESDFNERSSCEIDENVPSDSPTALSRCVLSTSVQSDLNFVGLERSPKTRFGRFGSTRLKLDKKIANKEFGQFLDAAATNASNAYAKLRQFKKAKLKDKGANRDIGVSPKGTPTKSGSRDDLRTEGEQGDSIKALDMERSSWPNSQKVVRSGWLKKQGGMIKTWNERWFVLKGDILYYYRDKDQTKLLGTIMLRGNHVVDYPYRASDPNKYLFEVVPGDDRQNLGKNHNTYLMSSNSQSDKDEWIRAMKKMMKRSAGPAIFGQELTRTMRHEEEFDNKTQLSDKQPRKQAPDIIEKCCAFIRQNGGFYEEGLFRLPGHANEVKELQDSFDMGEKPNFDKSTDTHTVTSLMKSFLRELPEPLVTFRLYEPLIEAAKLANAGKQSVCKITDDSTAAENEDAKKAREIIKRKLKQLPKENFDLLRYLCRFLDEVQEHSEKNKMDIANLALVFGPNIIRAEKEAPLTMMSNSTYVQFIMSEFIRNHDYFFPDDEPSEVPSSIPDVVAASRQHCVSNKKRNVDSSSDRPDFLGAVVSSNPVKTTAPDGFDTINSQFTPSQSGTIGLRHVTDDSGTGSLGPTPDNTSKRAVGNQRPPVKQREYGRTSKPRGESSYPQEAGVSKAVHKRESFYDNVMRSADGASESYRDGKAGSDRKTWRCTIESQNRSQDGCPSPSSSYLEYLRASSQRSSTNAVAGSSIAESVRSFDADALQYSPVQLTQEADIANQRFSYNSDGKLSGQSSGPKPPVRKRRGKKNDLSKPSTTNSHYVTDEESNTESVPPDDQSIRSSRDGSMSSVNDPSNPRRSRGFSGTKRPTTRPPPPPAMAGLANHPQPHAVDRSKETFRDPTYEELQQDIRILQEKLKKQGNEFKSKTRFIQELLVRQIKELRSSASLDYDEPSVSGILGSPEHPKKATSFDSHTNAGVEDVTGKKIRCEATTRRHGHHLSGPENSEDFKTPEEHIKYLRKCISEERKLREMTEIQLKDEKRGRIAAEERNAQLQREIRDFFSNFGR